MASYDLTFKAQGGGGAYTATLTTLVDGEPVLGSRGPGLAQAFEGPHVVTGAIGPGEGLDGVRLDFAEGRGIVPRPPPERRGSGDIAGRMGATGAQVGTAARELETGVAPESVVGHLGHGDVFPPCPGAGSPMLR